MNEYEEYLADEIRLRVWSGFHSLADILMMLEDCDEPDSVDQEMLAELARSEFQAKREAEVTWPSITDCDRLEDAFYALISLGVVALHNAGYTMSDGLSAVGYELVNYHGDQVKGYCFYHEQDVGRAVDGYGLWVAFGDLDNTESGKRAVGQLVKTELERQGFIVTWDGDPNTRIDLPKILWQRRTPNNE